MLMLARDVGGRIMIGDDIIITVSRIDPIRNQVILGFEAPDCVSIDREEIRKRKIRYQSIEI